jgi:hypothetical protein
MMLNEPMTSSSHWRIPKAGPAQRDEHVARIALDERSLRAAATRIGAQTQVAARSAAHAIVAGLLIGGVLVAPVLAILAVVGLFAPPLAGARQIAPALIFGSLLWLALAIFGAHTQVERCAEAHEADPGAK